MSFLCKNSYNCIKEKCTGVYDCKMLLKMSILQNNTFFIPHSPKHNHEWRTAQITVKTV